MSKYHVYLVGGSHIQNRKFCAIEAENLYLSPIFKACKAYVESVGGAWLILSEMNGIVWPDTMLAPYKPGNFEKEEVSSRLHRSFQVDALANTLICMLNLQPEPGMAVLDWKKSIVANTTFTLLGESDFLRTALTEIQLAGAVVEYKKLGLVA